MPFETSFTNTFEEHSKMNAAVLAKNNKRRLFNIVAILILFAVYNLLTYLITNEKVFAGMAVFILIVAAVYPFIFKSRYQKLVQKLYDDNKITQNLKSDYKFFEDHFERSTSYVQMSFKYEELYKIMETDSNFYMMITQSQILGIAKENCSPELIEFLHKLATK